MKSVKGLCVALMFTLAMVSCGPKQEGASGKGRAITISGKVGFPKEGKITIANLADTTNANQELSFDRSSYTFKGTVNIPEPGYYRITFFDEQTVDVILDKNDIEVNVDGNQQGGYFEVIGSPDIELFKKLGSIQQRFQQAQTPELAQLNSAFQAAVARNDEAQIMAIQQQYQKIVTDSMVVQILKYTPSVAVIDILKRGEINPDQYFDVYQKVAQSINSGDWANYAIGKEYLDMFNRMKSVAIGQVAPEIELPNPDGKLIKLSSLRGKYVLVDFWAKWCGPCRAENPNVVAAYKTFNSKGFEVFGVSLDRNKADWLKAIQDDGLTWTHVSDLKYFNSEAARLYNINAIPFSILLDRNGVIIAKNLRGQALHQKLAEVLN